MKFSWKRLRQKSRKAQAVERHRVLEFIQNHAAKADFLTWLNSNYNQQFPEDIEWDNLIKTIRADDSIHTTALHNYARTLTDDEDVAKLLKDVEKQAEKAEETVSELYEVANTRRLQPIIGGASLLGGMLLLIVAAGLLTGVTELGLEADLRNYLATISGLYGILCVVSGMLLILR